MKLFRAKFFRSFITPSFVRQLADYGWVLLASFHGLMPRVFGEGE